MKIFPLIAFHSFHSLHSPLLAMLVRRSAAWALRRSLQLRTRALHSTSGLLSSGGSSDSSAAPVYSRHVAAPSASGHTKTAVANAATTAAMMKEAARLARQAAEDPLTVDNAETRDRTGEIRQLQEQQARARAIASGAPELQQADPMVAPTLDEMRAEAGWLDPSDPRFTFKGPDQSAVRYMLMLILIGGPVLLYHFSSTVRGFTDRQIDTLTKLYEAKFGPLTPATDRFAVGAQAAAAATPKVGGKAVSATLEELQTAKRAQEEKIRTQEEAVRQRKQAAAQAKVQAAQQQQQRHTIHARGETDREQSGHDAGTATSLNSHHRPARIAAPSCHSIATRSLSAWPTAAAPSHEQRTRSET